MKKKNKTRKNLKLALDIRRMTCQSDKREAEKQKEENQPGASEEVVNKDEPTPNSQPNNL